MYFILNESLKQHIPNVNLDNEHSTEEEKTWYMTGIYYRDFLSQITNCYNANIINNDKYISLLNGILYYNVYQLFNTINDTQIQNNCMANKMYIEHLCNGTVLQNSTKQEVPFQEWLSCSSFSAPIRIIKLTATMDLLVQTLIPMYIMNSKYNNLQYFAKDKSEFIINDVRDKILDTIILAICDNDVYTINGKEQSNCYSEILKKEDVRKMIDDDFCITEKIKNDHYFIKHQQYYIDDFLPKFKSYYRILRGQSKNDKAIGYEDNKVDSGSVYNNDKTQKKYRSIDSVKSLIEKHVPEKLQSKIGDIKEVRNTPIPESIVHGITKYLINTNKDYKLFE